MTDLGLKKEKQTHGFKSLLHCFPEVFVLRQIILTLKSGISYFIKQQYLPYRVVVKAEIMHFKHLA